MRTIFPKEYRDSEGAPQELPNISDNFESDLEQPMKFPKRLRYRGRGKVLATIYKRTGDAPYRLYWRAKVDGVRKTRTKDFSSYSAAKRKGDQIVADLAKDSDAAKLTPGQASDALAALEQLQGFYQATGRKVSLRAAVAEYTEASAKLSGRTLGEAVDGYLLNLGSVKRVDISKAVEEFITGEEPRTKALDGKRPELSPKYHYDRSIKLRRFAATFPNTAVCELAKEHLDMFFANLGNGPVKSRNRRAVSSAKSRNHHRAAVKQFLQWAVRKDYLTVTHRLLEADGMRPDKGNAPETEFYAPKELRELLDAATGDMSHMRPLVALSALAGLQTSEVLRLDWADVWRVRRHIEVTASKNKTRQRRLVEICPALSAWLQPYRLHKVGKLCTLHEITYQQHFVALCDSAKVKRKPNGLRHGFCTYHFAAYGNENETAKQAGNSPAMIHAHYKGLATKKEAKAWFGIRPAKSGNIIDFRCQK